MPHKFPGYKVKVNGIYIHYVKIGRGKPLVFIHGWANNWQGWIPLVDYLRKSYTLYLLDLPGFGHSGNLTKYTLQTNSSYVSKFIKKLDLTPHAVIGLSMGSFVAADLLKNHGNGIKSAILLGPLLKDKTDRWLYKIVPAYLKIFNRNRLTRAILKKILQLRHTAYLMSKYVNMYKFNKEYIDKYGTQGRKLMRIEAFIEMGLSINSYDLKKTLLKINSPTLLVYGREDKIASYRNAQELLPENRNLTLEVIPFAGHMVHWEQTEKLANAIREFLTLQGQPLRG